MASCDHTSESLWLYGVSEGEGLYVQICTEEHDPLARCTEHHEMVCKDSAVEVFLAFAEKGKELTNNDMYLNFEVNANGAMYAKIWLWQTSEDSSFPMKFIRKQA